MLGIDGRSLGLKIRVPGRRAVTVAPGHPQYFDLFFHNPGIPEHPEIVSSGSMRLRLRGIPQPFVVGTPGLDLLAGDELFTSGLSPRRSG